MRRLALSALVCALAACTIFDDHEPCSRIDGPPPSAPVPGELPGTGPTGGDNDATYRMSNGIVCRCDGSEVGCYKTPEEAEIAATCQQGVSGADWERNCQSGAPAPDAGEVDATASYRCEYDRIERATGKGETKYRWQVGKDGREATRKHIQWCDDQSASDKRYRYSCGPCSEP